MLRSSLMARTTVDRPLTVRQTKFAAAVANGTPKAAAHRENYKADGFKSPRAQVRRAADIAKRPNVAAEIRRLTWLSCPPADDIRGMREHSIRVLSDLSRSSPSDEVRLKAALALYRIAETTRAAANPSAEAAEQDKLLASLRRLYVEVQGKHDKASEAEPPPLVRYDDDAIDIDAIAEPAAAEDFTPEK